MGVEVPPIESREVEHAPIPEQPSRDFLSPLNPPPGPIRHRRHSAHIHMSSSSTGDSNRFEPYSRRARIGRSVSPVRDSDSSTRLHQLKPLRQTIQQMRMIWISGGEM